VWCERVESCDELRAEQPDFSHKKLKNLKNQQNPFEPFVLFRGSIYRLLNRRRTPFAPVQRSAFSSLRQEVSIHSHQVKAHQRDLPGSTATVLAILHSHFTPESIKKFAPRGNTVKSSATSPYESNSADHRLIESDATVVFASD